MCNSVNLKLVGIIDKNSNTYCAAAHRRKLLLLTCAGCPIFSNSSIILTGLRGSIGVTHSYSSRLRSYSVTRALVVKASALD